MLLNLHKKSWIDGLTLQDYNVHSSINEATIKDMLELAKNYNKVGATAASRFGQSKKTLKSTNFVFFI